MKNHKILALLFICSQITFFQAAQESKIETEENRQEIIDEAMKKYPKIIEELDLLRTQYPVILNFHDYLESNLARDDQEPNLGELHCQAIDFVTNIMKKLFLKKIREAISEKCPSIDHIQDPIFLYVMQHADEPEIFNLKDWFHQCHGYDGTLLHEAVRSNNIQMVQSLLQFNLDIDYQDTHSRWTALFLACCKGYSDIARILVMNGADVNFQDWHGLTMLFYAIDPGYDYMQTHKNMLSILLDLGVNPNIPDKNGYIPMCIAIKYANKNDVEMLLKAKNANLNYKHASSGNTCLHYAVDNVWHSWNDEIVNSLLYGGVNPNIQNKAGNTPLHMAVRLNRIDVARMLLYFGADKTIPNNNGITVFQHEMSPEMRSILTSRFMRASTCSIS